MKLLRLASIFAVMTGASAAPIYTLADLGTLGGDSAMASGLNGFGQAVGAMAGPSGFMNAFSFNGTGSTNLTMNSTAIAGQASGINNAGQIAGTQQIGSQTYATVWTNGVPTTVAGAGSYATAINQSGNVAGMLINNGRGTAFVTDNGSVIDLGSYSGGSWSAAYGLNDEGQVAGYGMAANGSFNAFLWIPGAGYTILGTLGGANSYAMAINNSGIVVGASQVSSGYLHAFVYNGNSMQDLGTLGGSSSYAYGINNAGNIVGYSYTSANQVDGFLEEGGVMYDINALLINDPGWQITQLYGINDSNQLVGVGVFQGVEHAVLLTDPPPATSAVTFSFSDASAPEPGSWVLISSGLAGLLLGRLFRLQRSRCAGG